jgi:two-component system response regulator AtoC
MEQNSYPEATLSPSAQVDFADPPLIAAMSPSMRSVESVVSELAHSPVPVLLIGEQGTGKQMIARRIHLNSGWRREDFCVKSCRDLSPKELEAPMAFSRATLYLSEIGDLSVECQKKLLDQLSKQGTNGSSRTEVRVVCGSSRDLEPEVHAGSFREDLYYLLSGICLRIPPLRQRKEDIPHLIKFFLQRYAEMYGNSLPELSASSQKLFLEHSWPGNIPELETAVRAIVAVGDEAVAMGGLRSILTRPDHRGNGEKTSLKEASRAASREAERELILKVLTRTRWNRRRAAQELQISYKALLYKLKQIGYGEYGAS